MKQHRLVTSKSCFFNHANIYVYKYTICLYSSLKFQNLSVLIRFYGFLRVCNLHEMHLLERQILEKTKDVTFVLCAMSIVYRHNTARWQYKCIINRVPRKVSLPNFPFNDWFQPWWVQTNQNRCYAACSFFKLKYTK